MKRLLAGTLLGLLYVAATRSAAGAAPAATATLVAGLILLGGHITGHLLSRVGLPRITGYLGAGILIGPDVLDVIDTGVAAQLGFLNELAVAFIALAAGAELRLQELRQRLALVGRLTLSTSLLVGAGVSGGVYLGLPWLPFAAGLPPQQGLAVAILFGILAVARSPSSALAIIRECRARGPFPDTVLGVTVAVDVLTIVLFATGLSVCETLISSSFDVGFALSVAVELIGGIGLGLVLGAALAFYTTRAPGHLALLLLGTALVVTQVTHGIAAFVHVIPDLPLRLEPLLICVTAGFVVRNLSAGGDRFAAAVDTVSLPVFVLFFCLAGAALDLGALRTTWLATLALVALRAGMLIGSGWLGGRGDPHAAGGWIGAGFLTQAGISLGLALEVGRRFPEWGDGFVTIAVATISVNQLIGPVALKVALQRASARQTVGGPDDSNRAG